MHFVHMEMPQSAETGKLHSDFDYTVLDLAWLCVSDSAPTNVLKCTLTCAGQTPKFNALQYMVHKKTCPHIIRQYGCKLSQAQQHRCDVSPCLKLYVEIHPHHPRLTRMYVRQEMYGLQHGLYM